VPMQAYSAAGISQQLPRRWRDAPKAAPQGSRLRIDTTGGALSIEIPPDGFSGSTASTGAPRPCG
jgi:hypothetical protein